MAVQVQLSKWGNSLAFRLPRDLAARTGLTEGMRVDLEAQSDGSILLRKSSRRFTLEELLAGMTPDREHSAVDDTPRGEEIL